MLHILQIVLTTILSAFGAVFVCWAGWRGIKNSDDPVKILFKVVFSAACLTGEILFARKMIGMLHEGDPGSNIGPALLLVISIALCGVVMAIVWTPHISDFLISPLTDLFDGGKLPPEPKPFYSIAYSKRKLNHPLEAINLVRAQLEKFPNDYEGINLVAAIQAEDMNDLPAAENTLNRFCDQKEAPSRQVAAALTMMADWHLKLGKDIYSAQTTLQRIIDRYPDTELSTAAAQRIAHLGGAEKIMLAAHDRRPVVVPEGVKSAGLRDTMRDLVPVEASPETLATDYVRHLAEHPLDGEVREKLAILYGTHYRRLDLAMDELNELMRQHAQSPKRVARWLNLFADMQVRAGLDFDTVRPTLEKIVELYPDLPAGVLARSRLAHLKLEIKGKQKEPEHKVLGEYEQNLGIKYGKSYGSPSA